MIPDPIDVGDDIVDAVDWNDVLSVWLQPLATVITGLLAVLAAAIAYRAVTRQIKANAENVQKQIDAAAAEQQKNRDADWARLRRQEVLDLLLEAGTMARKLLGIAVSYSLATDPELSRGDGLTREDAELGRKQDERVRDATLKEFAELNSPDRLPIMLDKLKMHGLAAVEESLSDLEIEAGAVLQHIDIGEWTLPQKERAVFAAIEDVLREPPS